jgi:hypothetical protein
MLLDDPRVLDRHPIAGERDEAGIERLVLLDERGLLQVRLHGRGT